MKKANLKNSSEKLDKNLDQDITETYQEFLVDLMDRFSSSNNSLARFDLKTKDSAKKAMEQIEDKLQELEQFKKEAKSLKTLMEQKRWELDNE